MKATAAISGCLLLLLVFIGMDQEGFMDYRLPSSEFWNRVLIFLALSLVTVTTFLVSLVAVLLNKRGNRA